MNNTGKEKGIPIELTALCEATGIRKKGIAALMKYYMDICGWTETVAIEHIKELFENGTIDLIKNL